MKTDDHQTPLVQWVVAYYLRASVETAAIVYSSIFSGVFFLTNGVTTTPDGPHAAWRSALLVKAVIGLGMAAFLSIAIRPKLERQRQRLDEALLDYLETNYRKVVDQSLVARRMSAAFFALLVPLCMYSALTAQNMYGRIASGVYTVPLLFLLVIFRLLTRATTPRLN